MFKYKRIVLITLLVFGSAGFSFLDGFNFNSASSVLEAARRSNKKSSEKKSSAKTKKTESKKESANSSEDSSNNELLMDNEKSRDYSKEIEHEYISRQVREAREVGKREEGRVTGGTGVPPVGTQHLRDNVLHISLHLG